jgi:hypothetical protein
LEKALKQIFVLILHGSAEDDITFEIKPVYRNKPGFLKPDEVNFSSTTVTIDKGTSQKCVTFSSPIDDKLQEKQEFIEFEIAKCGKCKNWKKYTYKVNGSR